MSSADRTPSRRARTALTGAFLALLAGAWGCAAEADPGADAPAPTSAAAVPADGSTQRIAEVEFLRQCTVASTSFVDEATITTDLDDRLAAAGFTHEQWKQWHDALVHSPELVEQFAGISAAGCPAG